MITLCCPKCEDETNLHTVENIRGEAGVGLVTVESNGTAPARYDHDGETEVNWDSSETVAWGCGSCGWEGPDGQTEATSVLKVKPEDEDDEEAGPICAYCEEGFDALAGAAVTCGLCGTFCCEDHHRRIPCYAKHDIEREASARLMAAAIRAFLDSDDYDDYESRVRDLRAAVGAHDDA